jgi:hypothetical protein
MALPTGSPTGNPFPPKPAPEPCAVTQEELSIVEAPEGEVPEEEQPELPEDN